MIKGWRAIVIALWLYLPATLGLAALAVLSIAVDEPISSFTKDPAAVFGGNPFTGFLSNVGAFVWMSTAAISAFAAYSLYRWDGWSPRVGLLIAGFGLSAMLLFDDFFMIHELVWAGTLGLDERLLVLIYASLVGGALWATRAALGTTSLPLLAAAGFFFSMSIGVDRLSEDLLPMHHLFEDGAKFLGIVGWFGFFTSTAWAALDDARVKSAGNV